MKQTENASVATDVLNMSRSPDMGTHHSIEDGHAGLLDLRELDLLVLAPTVLTLPETAARSALTPGVSSAHTVELRAFSTWTRRLHPS